jgi:hypothetical protein
MAKTIDINSHSDYSQVISQTVDYLKESNLRIMEASINLAVAKEWREWNKTKQTGTVFSFDENMLSAIDDPNINELLSLKNHIEDVVDILTKD